MKHPIVQIYEIQTVDEAERMIELGVEHVGSVITSKDHRHDPVIRDTVARVNSKGAVSSLIPLYTDTDAVLDTLDYYRPQIVHFCDRLTQADDGCINAAIALQKRVKTEFPQVRIMRSIPISQPQLADEESVLAIARQLETTSDLFLTDTVLAGQTGASDSDQPVNGFVGITGQICDWDVAARLVEQSPIPVILAGGISPENVAEGVRRVRPFGVDSCTCTNALDENGVPVRFKKDLQRVRRLVAATREAAHSAS